MNSRKGFFQIYLINDIFGSLFTTRWKCWKRNLILRNFVSNSGKTNWLNPGRPLLLSLFMKKQTQNLIRIDKLLIKAIIFDAKIVCKVVSFILSTNIRNSVTNSFTFETSAAAPSFPPPSSSPHRNCATSSCSSATWWDDSPRSVLERDRARERER